MMSSADRDESPDDIGPRAGADGVREDEPNLVDVCRDALVDAGLRVTSAAPEAGAVMLVPNEEPDRAADGMIVGFASSGDCLRAWRALEDAGLVVPAIGPVWIEVAWPGDVLDRNPLVVDLMARRAA